MSNKTPEENRTEKARLQLEKQREEQWKKFEKRKERERKWRELSKRDENEGCEDHQILSKIGKGTYGVVFKATSKKTNELVALKKIRLSMIEGVPTTIIREIAILKELKHENIVRLLAMEQKDTIIYLAFEYAEVDLRNYMDKLQRPGLTIGHIRSFMHQMLNGLHYCHAQRILHRDLKPQNLLIHKSGRLCIADLGLSRVFVVPMRTYTHQVITLWYRAPEILLGSPQYSTAVDMWSVGCIFAEMLTLLPLFEGDSQIHQMFKIFQLLGTPSEDIWPGVTALPDYNDFPIWEAQDLYVRLRKYEKDLDISSNAVHLLKSLLTYDPIQRISAVRAESHPFFFEDLSLLEM